MEEIVWNILIGIITGLISGVLSGLGVSYFFERRSKKNARIMEENRLRDEFLNYLNEMLTAVLLLENGKGDKVTLQRLIMNRDNYFNESHHFIFNALQEGSRVESVLLLFKKIEKELDKENSRYGYIKECLNKINWDMIEMTLLKTECESCKNLKKCKKIGKCIKKNK